MLTVAGLVSLFKAIGTLWLGIGLCLTPGFIAIAIAKTMEFFDESYAWKRLKKSLKVAATKAVQRRMTVRTVKKAHKNKARAIDRTAQDALKDFAEFADKRVGQAREDMERKS